MIGTGERFRGWRTDAEQLERRRIHQAAQSVIEIGEHLAVKDVHAPIRDIEHQHCRFFGFFLNAQICPLKEHHALPTPSRKVIRYARLTERVGLSIL